MEPQEKTSTYSTAADAVDRMTLEMANLRSERDAALSEVRHLKMMLQTSQMSPESVKNNDRACMSLTGLTYQTFESVVEYLSPLLPKSNQKRSQTHIHYRLF